MIYGDAPENSEQAGPEEFDVVGADEEQKAQYEEEPKEVPKEDPPQQQQPAGFDYEEAMLAKAIEESKQTAKEEG